MTSNPFNRQPETPTNEALLAAITTTASAGTPEAYQQFYDTLLKSTLLIARDPDDDGPILFIGDDEDDIILPAFTDLDRLQHVFPDVTGYGVMPAPAMFSVALQNSISRVNINPQHGPGCYLERHELEALAQGKIPDLSEQGQPLGKPAFVPLGDPKLPSQEVIETMVTKAQALLGDEPSVLEGYVILMRGEGQDTSQLTLALYFSPTASNDWKSAFSQRFVNAIEATIKQPVNLIWLEGERYASIRAHVPPFYQREG